MGFYAHCADRAFFSPCRSNASGDLRTAAARRRAEGVLTGHAGVSQPAVSKHLAVLKLDFSIYPTFVAHATLAALLAGFIVLHVLAALFHQGVLKDGLLRRMLFGRREPISAALPDNRPKQRTAAR
jgi:cytochrome b